MDYSTLLLGPNQIRLLTIDPIPDGGDINSPIRCHMYVRSQPLPTSAPIYETGTIPPNYISFEHYVPNPPSEAFGEAIRRDIAKIELQNIEKEQQKHSRTPSALFARAADKLAAKLHLVDSTASDIMIPVDDIPNRLTREDFLSMTQDVSSGFPDMSIRTWESGEKTYGKLPLSQLNPLFKVHTKPAPPGQGLGEYQGVPLPSSSRPSASNPNASNQDRKLARPENYVALSYAWGLESDPHHTIYINDQPVSIRQNLFSALRQFRTSLAEYFNPAPPPNPGSPSQQKDKERGVSTSPGAGAGAIWIDALCINQLDEPEKSSQVQLMSTIYNLAGNILVWVGDSSPGPSPGSDAVIDFLETWSSFHRVEFVEAFDGSDPLTATTWRNMALLRLRTVGRQVLGALFNEENYAGGHPFQPGEAKALWEFFSRGYWKRLWIIQELAMGRPGMPVLCGGRVTLWRYIRDAVLLLAPVFDQLREAARADYLRNGSAGTDIEMEMEHPIAHVAKIAQMEISGHRRRLPHIHPGNLVLYAPAVMREGPLHGSTLRQAILLASRAECFKPHDRVYGMLSIPGLPARFGMIKVAYSCPVGEVFREFTALCVGVRSLDFLAVVDGVPPSGHYHYRGGDGNERGSEIPSWVPDYAAAPERRIGIIEGEWRAGGETGGGFPSFMGMGGACFPPKVLDLMRLECSGRVVDEVVAVGAVSKLDLDAAKAMIGDGDPSLFQVKQLESEPDETEPAAGGTSERPWPLAENILHKVVVGGCDLGGNKKAVEGFKVLYTAFPAIEPPKTSPSHRNWHFLNSSASLQIQGRPLSSYFNTGELSLATNSPQLAQAQLAMTARTKMRRFLVTKSGMIGLGPITAQPGDSVISIVGYGKPLIAHQQKANPPPEGETDEQRFWREYREPKIFRLRGEAYVEGMMNMEKMAVNSTKPELMLGSGNLDIGQLVFI